MSQEQALGAAPAAAAADHDAAEIDRHVRTYIGVFVALMVLTVVTVGVSYIDMSSGMAVAVAMFIATIKGSLVAGFFMHLVSEKKLITYTLVLTVFFFLFCLLMPGASNSYDASV